MIRLLLPLLLLPSSAFAQSISLDLGAAGPGVTSRIVQLTALITVLSLAPSLLVMMTAFARIVIVLSLLRSAIGTQGAPPNMVLIGLALFLTFFVMEPVLDQSWTTGLLPMTEGKVSDLD
jgi:flagellar biosynthetic protein FliP